MRLVIALLLAASSFTSVQAHEFWISPQSYQIAENDTLFADFRVGQKFKAPSYVYIPQQSVRFEVVLGDNVIPANSRIGDRPALSQRLVGQGLAVVVHETTDAKLTYTEWEKFTGFVEHKDFPGVLAAHAARGLPQTGFKETYRRYVKSLVAIGDGKGADRDMGLRTEIIALANPYTDDLSGGFPVRVMLDGKPRVDAQVEVFARAADDTVTSEFYRTDDQGLATFPVRAGTEYLVDAVVLEPRQPKDPAKDPVWHSDWASLTFETPK